MPGTNPSTPADLEALVRAETLDVLRECHARGPYPCPEADVKKRVAARLAGRVPAKGRGPLIGRILAGVASLDRSRVRAPRRAVFPGDEDRLYDLAPDEIRAAVEVLRSERKYPVALAALGARLRLTTTGRAAISERLLRGDVPAGLALVLIGKARMPKITLAGEEDFGRSLRKAEQLDLRIRLADRERGTTREAPRHGRVRFADAFATAHDHLAREERSPYVPIPKLREALPAWDRAAFDAGIVALCEADRFQLSQHEHPARLTAAEREAAILWGPERRPYHFVSRV